MFFNCNLKSKKLVSTQTLGGLPLGDQLGVKTWTWGNSYDTAFFTAYLPLFVSNLLKFPPWILFYLSLEQ
jgi:hypothetical protein